MPRRSRSRSKSAERKSKVSDSRRLSNIRQDSRSPRFDVPAVQRQAFVDEGNKALRSLLARSRSYQRAAYLAEQPPERRQVLETRPTRVFEAPAKRSIARTVRDFASVVSPTSQKFIDALVCARRKLRREFVFAKGGAGSRRSVKDRASPSKVRC